MKTTVLINSGILTALLAVLFLISTSAQAQNETESQGDEPKKEEVKKPDKPIRAAWEAGMLIETQTDLVWAPKTLEFVIQHRFGQLNSGTFDLLGMYASSNIRIGFNYGLFKNAQIGVGTTKDNKIQDVNWKYKILTQTRSNSMPIALTYYGNMEIDASDKDNFGAEYKFSNRMSYFNQLIISRKFSRKFTMQITANYARFNQVDTATYSGLTHDNFGIGIAGRYKFGSTSSILLEYDQPLTTPDQIKPNLSLGVELSSSSHRFHIFISTYRAISYQRNLTYNTNDFTNFAKGNTGILVGFNITRNWSF